MSCPDLVQKNPPVFKDLGNQVWIYRLRTTFEALYTVHYNDINTILNFTPTSAVLS